MTQPPPYGGQGQYPAPQDPYGQPTQPYGQPAQYPGQPQYPGQAQPQYPQQYPQAQYQQAQYQQAQYQQAQYPQGQYPYGAPPPAKSKTGLIILIAGIVSVLLIGGAIGAVLIARGGGGGGGSPTAAVEGMLTAALKDKDEAKANSYVCAAQQGDAANLDELNKLEDTGVDLKISWKNVTEVSRSGDNAVVSVDLVVSGSMAGQELSQTMTLKAKVVKEGGSWKVCGTA